MFTIPSHGWFITVPTLIMMFSSFQEILSQDVIFIGTPSSDRLDHDAVLAAEVDGPDGASLKTGQPNSTCSLKK